MLEYGETVSHCAAAGSLPLSVGRRAANRGESDVFTLIKVSKTLPQEASRFMQG